ncbi:hypothetical protein M2375_003742 [Comamonas sp. BIGb0152]|uniref:S1 family peptidase n=1 Tax=Comamonas sp. BIGb0152 TaxID=2940601 RepID=UPI002166E954|nr:S1 family peptidase [Comamonas sp. BIGb0152]MCS4295499.1 hypothetical protein [Comamonas sp. BIGb0152]
MIRVFLAIAFPLLVAHSAANAFNTLAPTESQCAAIFKAAGDKYAGMWLGSDGKLVLGLTSPIALNEDIQKNLRIAYVKYGIAELERFHNQVINKFNSNQYITGSQIDYKINRIVVTARKGNLSKAKKLFEAQGVDVNMVNFEIQHATITFMPVIDDGSCKRPL